MQTVHLSAQQTAYLECNKGVDRKTNDVDRLALRKTTHIVGQCLKIALGHPRWV